jgi:PAS domain S-box-containing protein
MLIVCDSQIVFANPAAARLHGESAPEALIGRSIFDFLSPARHGEVRQRIETILRNRVSGPPQLYELHRDDGSVRMAEISSVAARWRGQPAIHVVSRDVTGKMARQRELRDSQALIRAQLDELEALYGAAPVGLALIDRTFRFRRVNARLADISGFPPEAYIGHSIYEVFPHLADEVAAQLRRVFDSGQPFSSAYHVPDTEREWITEFYPVKSADGEVTGVACTVQETTEFNRLVAEHRMAREEAQRANAAKSRFLAAVSHDIRQPLQGLRLFIDLLIQRLDGSTEHAIIWAASRALRATEQLLDNLLDLSRLDAGAIEIERKPVVIGDLLHQLSEEVAAAATEKGLDLLLVPCRARVDTDPVQASRIIRNLLHNAVRHTIRGRILMGCRRRPGAIEIQVWDTGPGIPSQARERIFDDFYQVNPHRDQGLGLGLGIVKRTADLLGHPVSVRSWPARGTVFTLLLPRLPDPPP